MTPTPEEAQMGGSHGHGDVSLRLSTAARTVLAVAVVITLTGTLAAMAWLWPRDVQFNEQARGMRKQYGVIYTAQVMSAVTAPCDPANEDRLPDGTLPTLAQCTTATVRLTDSHQVVEVTVPAQSRDLAGTRVRVARYQSQGAPVWVWVDVDRSRPLLILVVVLAVCVLVVGRLRGLAAIAGLAVSFATIFWFIIPALHVGRDPLLVAVTGSVAIMTVILYVAHGFTAKTTAALVGTVAGLLLTALLGFWATGAARLDGLNSEERYQLLYLTDLPDLSGLILCGVILAGLGVLNDVTITQASAVWELRASSPSMGRRDLFAAGMRIGRDHLASTVYTVVFAYAGSALPLLMLIWLYQQPTALVLTSSDIAEEIVRTCVGAIGLVASIPLTTAVAALLAVQGRAVEGSGHAHAAHDRGGHGGDEHVGGPSRAAGDRAGGDDGKPSLLSRLARLRSNDTVPDLRAVAPKDPRDRPVSDTPKNADGG
jgi:uncharacterized membrane protein